MKLEKVIEQTKAFFEKAGLDIENHNQEDLIKALENNPGLLEESLELANTLKDSINEFKKDEILQDLKR